MSLIHASYHRPSYFPARNNVALEQLDRVQDLTGSASLNREKIKEVGRDGTVGYKKSRPTVNLSMRQLEYGKINAFTLFANKVNTTDKLDLNDFTTSYGDFVGYMTDDDGNFKGSVVYPEQRLASFSIGIGDPDALIERNFAFVGEDEWIFQGDNGYYIRLDKTVESGEEGTLQIVFNAGDYSTYPVPAIDPDQSGDAPYFAKIIRQRGDTTTKLVAGVNYSYVSGTNTLSILLAEVEDSYHVYYTADSYIDGAQPFTNNDTDEAGITADSCSLFLGVGNYLYTMQSANADVSLTRRDQGEIGNPNVTTRGVQEKAVSISLGKTNDGLTIEEILRGVASNYGKIDIRKLSDSIKLVLKIYSDNTKSEFLMGYEWTNLSPTTLDGSEPVDDYTSRNYALEGEECIITDNENELSV